MLKQESLIYPYSYELIESKKKKTLFKEICFCVMFLREYQIPSFTNKIEVLLDNNLWNCFLYVLNFVYDKDVEDLCSFSIIGFESHFEIFRPSRQGS